jgi:hypothetical protein
VLLKVFAINRGHIPMQHYVIDIYEKVKVKFSLEQSMKAQRGCRSIPLLFL